METPSAGAARRRVPLALACVAGLAAVGALAYANTFEVPFALDDFANISVNEQLEHPPANRYVPQLTFALQARLTGLALPPLHAGNLAIHLAAAACVLLLVRALLSGGDAARRDEPRALLPALLAGALFVAHPIQTQAVTYLVQRHASLCSLLYLATLVLYLGALRSRFDTLGANGLGTDGLRVPLYVGALVTAALAAFSKEIALTLPVALGLLEVLFLTGSWRARALRLAPFVLAVLPIPLLRLGGSGGSGGDLPVALAAAARVDSTLSRGVYATTQLGVLLRYLGLLVWPAGQNVDHDPPVLTSLLEPEALAGAVVLLAMVSVALLLWRRAARTHEPEPRVAGFGILFFFVALAVESTFVPILDVMFEHRLYLPSAGLFAAVAALVAWGARLAPRRLPARAVAVACAACVAALAVASFRRNALWNDPVRLWADAVEKSPNRSRTHYNLANAWFTSGNLAAAIPEWERSVELDPNQASALNQLANVALLRGDPAAAIAFYRRSAATGLTASAPAHYNLALLAERAGDHQTAIAEYVLFLRAATTSEFAAQKVQVRRKLAAAGVVVP